MVDWGAAAKLFAPKSSYRLTPAELTEDVGELANPMCGWYQIFRFRLDRPEKLDDLKWCLHPNETLALVMVDISEYRNRELDDHSLAFLKRILQWFCDSGLDIILRPVYDTVGKGMEHEPSRFDLVQKHLLQLTAVVRDYPVLIWHGILVGSWGEMHDSRYLSNMRICQMISILERELPKDTFLAVRRPMFYRMIRPMEQWGSVQERRIGLYNDGIFGSKTDLGTYGTQSFREAGWEQPWLPFEEQNFQDQLCRTVPQGGEAVLSPSGLLSLEETVSVLRKIHVSYLNSQHDVNLLEAWRSQNWQSKDGWNGMNGFDYIGRHLGYRYRIVDVKGEASRKSDVFCVRVTFENIGFSPAYRDLKLTLVQRLPSGELTKYDTQTQLRDLSSSERKTAVFEIQPEESELYLCLTRACDGRTIRLANRNTGEWDGGLYLGKLSE